MKSVIRTIAIASSIIYAVFIGIAIVSVVNKELTFAAFLGLVLCIGVSLILLWALYHALARIERLENILLKKNVITDKDAELEDFGYVEETPDNLSSCKTCGYQLFPEDKVCPNCKTPRDDSCTNKDE